MPKANGLRGILFVSHDACRAGAQIELLHFLRWFKKKCGRPFSILLPSDGELSKDFSEIAETWAIDRSRWCPGGARARTLRFVGLGARARRAEVADIWRFLSRSSPGLIYMNSISSAWADMLPPDIPTLTHVHELEFAFRMQSQPRLQRLLAMTQQFIACSEATGKNLVKGWGVPAERVETVHEFVPVNQIRAGRQSREVFDELGVPRDAQLVLGCGTADWRKGVDLFIQTARLVCRQRRNTFFVWVGARTDQQVNEFEHDARAAGLSQNVILKRSVPGSADYIAAGDVFVLTSREDPFPLVCLEAAALEKPIVCFAGAGGMPEFVEDDCGFVVPYLDVVGMADRVLGLLASPECRAKMGAAAKRKVTERHDIGVTAPRIMEIIERTMSRG